MENDKASVAHVDAVENANMSESEAIRHTNSANEEIVQHLQTTGEEVGMTWRTIMAASVSLSCQLLRDDSNPVSEHGHVLLRISFYAFDTSSNPQLYQC